VQQGDVARGGSTRAAAGKDTAQAKEALARARRLIAVAGLVGPDSSGRQGVPEVHGRPKDGAAGGTSPLATGADVIAAAAAGLDAAVRYSLPDWLWERLQASHGDRADAIAAALLQPSPIDIRVNLLVGKAGELARRLREQGVASEPIAGVPTGLRILGRFNLEKLDLFERGWFEIQDAGSQRQGLAAGKVLSFDTGNERLSRLMPRARRARVEIVEPMRLDGVDDVRLARYRRRADLVLVDAPCSGIGTLRRSPDMKWRLTPKRLLQHVAEQRAILAAAAALVKPGGTLVYATCSLLREENEQQAADFHGAGFELVETRAWLPDEGPSSGFFVAKWVLQA